MFCFCFFFFMSLVCLFSWIDDFLSVFCYTISLFINHAIIWWISSFNVLRATFSFNVLWTTFAVRCLRDYCIDASSVTFCIWIYFFFFFLYYLKLLFQLFFSFVMFQSFFFFGSILSYMGHYIFISEDSWLFSFTSSLRK